MKKISIILAILISTLSCTKERFDEPVKKKEYVVYYWRIDGVEKTGKVYSSINVTTKIEKPK